MHVARRKRSRKMYDVQHIARRRKTRHFLCRAPVRLWAEQSLKKSFHRADSLQTGYDSEDDTALDHVFNDILDEISKEAGPRAGYGSDGDAESDGEAW